MKETIKVDRRFTTWNAYRIENGPYQLLAKLVLGACRRVRDEMLSRRIGCGRVRIGKGPKVRGLRHLVIGSDFAAGDYLWLEAVTEYNGSRFDPRIAIGDSVGLSDFVHIAATNEVVIGDGVLIGSRVLISDHNHGQYIGANQSHPTEPPAARALSNDRKVKIGQNVWIGDGVAVLAGAVIGAGTVIGANSVVAGTIPSNCIAMGIPARPVKYFNNTSRGWEKEEIGR